MRRRSFHIGSILLIFVVSLGALGSICPDEPGAVLDHFKCYGVHLSSTSSIREETVLNLEDQFGAIEARVGDPAYLCNPVAKTYDGALTPIANSDHHLTLYSIACNTTQTWLVEVDNQFGEQELTVSGPVMVAVPTQKGEHSEPEGLDHFLLYWIQEDTRMQPVVDLEDQWHVEENVQVARPAFFAIPAEKTHDGVVTEIQNPDEHLVFYKIVGEHFQTDVDIVNQFGEQTLSTYPETQLLAVPSEKISFEPGEPPEPEPGPLALDHFKCYWLGGQDLLNENVHLEDQFGDFDATLNWAYYFCNPVEKTSDGAVTEIKNSDHHLTIYDFYDLDQPQTWSVQVDNQFGTQQLTVSGPIALAVPTKKEGHDAPVGLDHFLLYEVTQGPNVNVVVDLDDQFGYEPNIPVTRARFFANPVQKTHDGDTIFPIQHPNEHLVFYDISGAYQTTSVNVVNQFGGPTLDTYEPALLAVPSEKTSFVPGEPPDGPPGPLALDHFKCYWIEDEVFLGDYVYLEDQFLALEAQVVWAYYFCNPTEKTYNGVMTPILHPDHHLLICDLYYEAQPQMWSVQVDNQFGTQQLTVSGPWGIAVPTQKQEPYYHQPPVGLDHFLLYEVIQGPNVNVYVGLDDQFGPQPEVYVYDAYIFANPVRKTDETGMVTDIQNWDEHLVFYNISGYPVDQGVHIANQFGEQAFSVNDPELLAVPSEKISFEPFEPESVALDHFECYEPLQGTGDVVFITPPPWQVYVEDQFIADEAEVGVPWYFCNPAEKTYNGMMTPILDHDHHLTIYSLQCYDVVGQWSVQFSNQFGIQQLTVQGPVALAVPTQKLEPGDHDPPAGLDHFLLYEVTASHGGMWQVDLNDQFGYRPNVDVTAPLFFANPVKKTHGDMVWEIQNPQAHLVFYSTLCDPYSYPLAIGVDQFAQWYHDLDGPWLLAVPSQKMNWEQQPMQ